MTHRTCSEQGCDSPHSARGYCGRHYQKLYRTPNGMVRPARRRCRRCKTAFSDKWGNKRVYCSPECHRADMSVRRKGSNMAMPAGRLTVKACLGCQQPYTANQAWQKYCSVDCKRRAYRKRGYCGHCGRVDSTPGAIGSNGWCRECSRERDAERRSKPDFDRAASSRTAKAWRLQHVEKRTKAARIYNRRVRQEVIGHYGGRCACCGETEDAFLAIDHIAGNGNKHRRENNTGLGARFYLWLRRNGFPEGFQVLCHNCNMAKHILGVCPHQAA